MKKEHRKVIYNRGPGTWRARAAAADGVASSDVQFTSANLSAEATTETGEPRKIVDISNAEYMLKGMNTGLTHHMRASGMGSVFKTAPPPREEDADIGGSADWIVDLNTLHTERNNALNTSENYNMAAAVMMYDPSKECERELAKLEASSDKLAALETAAEVAQR